MADVLYGPAFKRSLEQIVAASSARIDVLLTKIVAKYLDSKESR